MKAKGIDSPVTVARSPKISQDIRETKPGTEAGAAPVSPPEISMRGFVKELRRIDQLPISQTFVFLVGAGASISSGIPGAQRLADTWLAEMHELDPKHNGIPFHQWMHDGHHGIPKLNPKHSAASYSEVFDRRFAANPSQGFAFLTKLMQDAQPGFGYSVLATLLARSRHRAVVTTNFDSLVERALLYYTDHTPLTCTDETAAGAFDKDLSCPLIIKCHRDLHLHPHNGVSETSRLHDNFGKALKSLLPGKVLIAVGYGGNDPSLMGFLEALPKDLWPAAVYWCYWDKGGPPGGRILKWVADHNGRFVAIPGFDELMSGIKGEFGYELLEKEMQKQHNDRVKRYKEQVEQIVSREAVTAVQPPAGVDGGRDTGMGGDVLKRPATANAAAGAAANSDAVNFASESITKTVSAGGAERTAWKTLLSILAIEDPTAKEAAFKKAMSEFPEDIEIPRHYARFLGDLFRYSEAARVLDQAISIREKKQAPIDGTRAAMHTDRSRLRWLIGDLAGAEADLQKSIDWGEAQSPRDERSLAIRYASRASIRRDRGDLAGAQADIQKSIDWVEAQTPRDERSLAMRYASRAGIRRDRGDLAGAEADIQKSIDWAEAQTPRDERSLAVWYASRASIRRDRGDLAGAEADIQKCIEWGEAQTPRDERGLAIGYASRAGIRHDRGDLAGAEADLQKSIDWGEAQTPRDERSLAIDYAARAGIRQDRGDLAGAEADIQKSIDWGEAQSPRDERSLAIDYASRASIRQDRGDLAGAEADLQKSIDWGEAQTPRDERGLAIGYASRASIRRDRGDLAGAEADIQKSIDWGEAQSPRDERGLAIDYGARAKIRCDVAVKARASGDSAGAMAGFAAARADIDAAISWYLANLPADERRIANFRKDKASIEQAERGG
jgi:hypothetical protein